MISVKTWLDEFTKCLSSSDELKITELFSEESLWRDYLPFGWNLQTIEGLDDIRQFIKDKGNKAQFQSAIFEGSDEDQEGFFSFQTNLGACKGYIRLTDGKCFTLFTMLEDLSQVKGNRPEGTQEPYVLIIGGGQSGLALGAQLSNLGIPYLIVDKHLKVGDQWRSRYESLVLHDPVWYDHMPFVPFPPDWPVFTPKDMMGDWLEAYAEKLSLNIQTDTEFVGATYDETQSNWKVKIRHDWNERELRPAHIVFALGISGFPKIPHFQGNEKFLGTQMHSSSYSGGAELSGKDVVVIGANNSAHDIASDLVTHSARPVMVQRSSTLVVRQEDYCEKILGPLYSAEAIENGITTEKADILQAATPIRLLEKKHKPLWDQIQIAQKDYYKRLTDAGFNIDFAEDGTGLGMKYRRTASGYYIDIGAAEMVADGRIAIRSGTTVKHMNENSVLLETGEELAADAVIYATGFGTMTDWVEALIDKETAQKIGECWGYGSGTKGDPEPWIGELRNMWMPTAQQGLWIMGGNLSQARFYSRLLGLQLAGRYFDANLY